MPKKPKEALQFEIDQLRKDKIIYALESLATTLTAFFTWIILGSSNLIDYQSELYAWGFGLVAAFTILFWLYVMIGNGLRLRKIRQLESQL